MILKKINKNLMIMIEKPQIGRKGLTGKEGAKETFRFG